MSHLQAHHRPDPLQDALLPLHRHRRLSLPRAETSILFSSMAEHGHHRHSRFRLGVLRHANNRGISGPCRRPLQVPCPKVQPCRRRCGSRNVEDTTRHETGRSTALRTGRDARSRRDAKNLHRDERVQVHRSDGWAFGYHLLGDVRDGV